MKTLGKSHKLCGKTAIDRLFAFNGRTAGNSTLAFPLRAVWMANPQRTHGEQLQALFCVPKKRLRHAVDRVLMRRRIREAYRLNVPRPCQCDAMPPMPVDIAFIYVADTPAAYADVEKAVKRILGKIMKSTLAVTNG